VILKPVQCDVQQQGADDTALRSPLLGGREPLARFEHPGFQPVPDHVPGGERPERLKKPGVVDAIERRRQVRIQYPGPLRGLLAGGLDRVLAAAAWPEPI